MSKFACGQAVKTWNKNVWDEFKIDISYKDAYNSFKEELRDAVENTGRREIEIPAHKSTCKYTILISF